MSFYCVSTNWECHEYVFAMVQSARMVWWISVFLYNPLVLGSNPTEPQFCRIPPHPSHVPDVRPCCPRLRLPARSAGMPYRPPAPGATSLSHIAPPVWATSSFLRPAHSVARHPAPVPSRPGPCSVVSDHRPEPCVSVWCCTVDVVH